MPDSPAVTIPEETAQQIEQVGPADFIVGLASHDNAATIGGVAAAARAGLDRAFPAQSDRTAVVHVDVGAPDGAADQVRRAMGDGRLVQASIAPDRMSRIAPALAARADGLKVLFTIAQRMGAKGCAVLEPDNTAASAEWAGRLLSPIARETADYVAPRYVRHRFAGALTTAVVHPFMRAVWGKRIRYPLGGDFACSARLIAKSLTVDLWRTDASRLGIDVGLTVLALCGGFRQAEAFLGARAGGGGDGLDLAATISRVLGALFGEVEKTVAIWQKVRGSEAVPLNGTPVPAQVEPVAVDRARALDAFRLGTRSFLEIWAPVLPPQVLLDLQKLVRQPDDAFRFPDALWARIVYDFALAWRLRVMHRDQLLNTFAPLYNGWLAAAVGELDPLTDAEVDARLERLCTTFESEKPYFISRWRSPDRFNP